MPNNNEIKAGLIIISLALVLAVLSGLYYLYSQLGIEKPLKKRLLELEPVQAVEIAKKDRIYEITIDLADDGSIWTSLQSVDRGIAQSVKGHDYNLILMDNRNSKLEEALLKVQPAIYQALATHQYVWLNEWLKDELAAEGIGSEFCIDEKFLFVGLQDGKHNLYYLLNPQYSSHRVSED